MKKRIIRPIKNTIGMFDLLKGIIMFLMVLFHNRSVFPEVMIDTITDHQSNGILKILPFVNTVSIVGRCFFSVIGAFAVSLMPALLIIAGYGIRKRSIHKCIKIHIKELIKPYLLTAIFLTLFHLCFHYVFFRYLPASVNESLKVMGGMLLGLSQTVQISGITLFANGPMWYALAMFWTLIVFNALLNLVDEHRLLYYSFGISIIGWLLSYLPFVPFCLSQGFVGVIYAYIGYLLKKSKLLLDSVDDKRIIFYTVSVLIPNIVFTYFGFVTKMADNVYSLGPITYIENGLMGVGVLYIFIRLNTDAKGMILNAIKYVGRYSLYFMCVHTVEMIAVPWYVFPEKFGSHQLLGFWIIYIIRMIIILFGCQIVIRFLELSKKIKSKNGR